jgi:predicted glycoside hydrolase/deacetylase ChbG (UPF0249 family)
LKRLVVNADDFGFTRDVNLGIIEAHRRGILTAATLMANGAAFEHAVELARDNPQLDVGCHLVLVGGRSVSNPTQELPASVRELMLTRRLDVRAELAAQIEKILEAGVRPYHLDTHKHTHLYPPVLGAVAGLSQRFGIPWVRRPFDFPLSAAGASWAQRAISRCLSTLRVRMHRVLAAHGCRTTDFFAGFQLTGRFHTRELTGLIRSLPQGTTEFMTHPGFCTDELRRARTRLKESRQRELEALTSDEVRQAIEEEGVELSGFRQLLQCGT